MKKQDRLQRAISSKILILKELSLKPSLGGRKRGTGRLETHQNGFKYIDHSRNEVHILFNNIKNAFFQKSKNTTAVIIHFHLINPIMIGKKPSKHVQVYRDVIERFEELGRRRRYDFDGTRAEQEEQKRIKRTNQQFKLFCDKSSLFAKENGFLNLEFEKPAMDLVFNGVPNKQSTNIYPTESCLIALEDSPAFVIDTKDIEIAHFERVNYSLRNFDLVFVYKDFTKEPHRITTIPRENIDTLQDFLNWKNVLYSQGKINLDWKTLINRIRSNLKGFVESGGWDFLLGQQQNEQQQQDNNDNNNNEPDEDEYIPDNYNSDCDYNSDDYSDDYSDDDDDDYSDDDHDDDFDDFESDQYSDNDNNYNHHQKNDEEQGLDWDELDRRAALEDKKAARKEAEDSRRSRINSRNQTYRSNHQISNYNKRRRY